MNRHQFVVLHFAAAIDRLTEQIKDATKHAFASWNFYAGAGVGAIIATTHAVSAGQCDASNNAAAHVLGDFAHKQRLLAAQLKVNVHRVVNFWNLIFRKLRVEGAADDLNDFAGGGHVESVV